VSVHFEFDELTIIFSFPITAISITCISPIEMIRTKMQAKKGFSYKGTAMYCFCFSSKYTVNTSLCFTFFKFLLIDSARGKVSQVVKISKTCVMVLKFECLRWLPRVSTKVTIRTGKTCKRSPSSVVL